MIYREQATVENEYGAQVRPSERDLHPYLNPPQQFMSDITEAALQLKGYYHGGDEPRATLCIAHIIGSCLELLMYGICTGEEEENAAKGMLSNLNLFNVTGEEPNTKIHRTTYGEAVKAMYYHVNNIEDYHSIVRAWADKHLNVEFDDREVPTRTVPTF